MATASPAHPLQFVGRAPEVRPVDPDWTCHRDGACCTLPAEVVMTREELGHIVQHLPEVLQNVRLGIREMDGNFIALKAQPCPFYLFGECQVYEHRPYNCRRFVCLRPDPKAEPFLLDQGPHGACLNQMDRVATSRVARRMAELVQRKAQRWGRRFGWS